jgi:putative peptide zinc metalloprotease protein
MSGPLLSSSWYRVSELKPRMRTHARMQRHRYRGQVWFVLQDPASGRAHRFTPAARLIMNGMDGERTVGALWEMANRRLGESAPSQDEFIHLLGQLHSSDLLQCDVSPDVAELFDRAQRQDRARVKRAIGNPMAIKVPLLDPDRLLDRLLPLVRPFWGWKGMLIWLTVVLPALLLVPPHWDELTHGVADRVFAVDNLVMLWLLFPLIKAFHELGHGIAAKAGGGEVHDMGLMLLVLMPVPYVDATSSALFRSKYERAVVGAAGMMVELALAAIAFYVWMLAEPGTLRAVAFNVMLIAGVSTLLFNGNPLLRYDAYYILSDLIEVPNLATRSMRYLGFLFERYAFGAREVEEPEGTRGEKAWFVFYGIASFLYRIVVVIAIILFIAGEFFIIGVVLALWAVVAMAVVPVSKTVHHLATSPRLARHRRRVAGVSFGVLAAVAAFVLWVPVPFRTQTEGVIWLPEQQMVRARANGFLARYLVEPGARVQPGDALIESVDPVLDAEIRLAQARVAELDAQFANHFITDRVQAQITQEALERELAALQRAVDRGADLIARSQSAGVFTVPHPADLPGRYFRKGEMVGYVIEPAQPRARVIVQQAEVDVVRLATNEVEIRTADRVDRVVAARIVRQVPGGNEELPSKALSTEGGGTVPIDPRDPKGTRTMQRVFQLELELDAPATPRYGGRVYVRFDHVPEPLGTQWYRGLRRLFLTRFNV